MTIWVTESYPGNLIVSAYSETTSGRPSPIAEKDEDKESNSNGDQIDDDEESHHGSIYEQSFEGIDGDAMKSDSIEEASEIRGNTHPLLEPFIEGIGKLKILPRRIIWWNEASQRGIAIDLKDVTLHALSRRFSSRDKRPAIYCQLADDASVYWIDVEGNEGLLMKGERALPLDRRASIIPMPIVQRREDPDSEDAGVLELFFVPTSCQNIDELYKTFYEYASSSLLTIKTLKGIRGSRHTAEESPKTTTDTTSSLTKAEPEPLEHLSLDETANPPHIPPNSSVDIQIEKELMTVINEEPERSQKFEGGSNSSDFQDPWKRFGLESDSIESPGAESNKESRTASSQLDSESRESREGKGLAFASSSSEEEIDGSGSEADVEESEHRGSDEESDDEKKVGKNKGKGVAGDPDSDLE